MTKEEYQASWDECLIKGWRADIDMTNMLKQFLLIVEPGMVTNGNFSIDVAQVLEFVTSLELRRCRDRDGSDVIRFISYKGPVRAFIADRCKYMNDCLWNEKNSAQSIIESIPGFKWCRKNSKSHVAGRRRRYEKKKAQCEKVISARSLCKRHDWGTVK